MVSNNEKATAPANSSGIPGMRGIEHIAITVPDLEEATAFFVDVLGCEVYYSIGPFKDPEGNWFGENLDVHPRAEIPEIRIVRCANGAHFELLTFDAPIKTSVCPDLAITMVITWPFMLTIWTPPLLTSRARGSTC